MNQTISYINFKYIAIGKKNSVQTTFSIIIYEKEFKNDNLLVLYYVKLSKNLLKEKEIWLIVLKFKDFYKQIIKFHKKHLKKSITSSISIKLELSLINIAILSFSQFSVAKHRRNSSLKSKNTSKRFK